MMERFEHKTYSIGDLVLRYGVAAQSLRNWEEQGLLPPARRTPGKHRRYGDEHVQALDALLGYRPPVAPSLRAAPLAMRDLREVPALAGNQAERSRVG